MKHSFERTGQRRLLTKTDFAAGQYRRRPDRLAPDLTDGSPFPFGTHRQHGRKMMDVPLDFYRWFLQQDWKAKWPKVQAYALAILADERVQRKAAPKPQHQESNPALAEAAFQAFRKGV